MVTFTVVASVANAAMVRRYVVKVVPVVGVVAATFYIATLAYLQALGRVRLYATGGSESPVLYAVGNGVDGNAFDGNAFDSNAFPRETRRVLQNQDSDKREYHGFQRRVFPQKRRSAFANETRCRERTNFVFIKCMKCATETMGTLLRRYGYMRNLSFVTPVGKNIYLGWPYKIAGKDYRANKTWRFNALVEHSIYDRDSMWALMPRDAAYITIIREPYSHFQSVFYYFNIVNIAKVSGPDPVSEYLKNVELYDATYRSHEATPLRYCIPDNFSITKNLLSHCMGMPLGFPNASDDITSNLTAIRSYLESLERDFTLVMLVEYFLESLVLLKRLMCWTAKDIIHHSVNILNYIDKTQPPSRANVKIYKSWSGVDYLLYDHFYRVFWRKIREQTPDFFDEVKQFRHTQSQVMYYCYKTKDANDLVVPRTNWDEAFHFSRNECDLMSSYMLDKIKDRYDKM